MLAKESSINLQRMFLRMIVHMITVAIILQVVFLMPLLLSDSNETIDHIVAFKDFLRGRGKFLNSRVGRNVRLVDI